MFEIHRHPSPRELRQFAGLWFPAFWAVVGLLLAQRTGHWGLAGLLWTLAAVISGLGLARPAWIRPVFVGWMLAAAPIGWCVSRLILTVVYFLVVTPIGLLRRLGKRDPLGRQFDRTASSYWTARPPAADPARYFRQF